MEERKAIEEMACVILNEDPDPVVRFRLLRDVLKDPPKYRHAHECSTSDVAESMGSQAEK